MTKLWTSLSFALLFLFTQGCVSTDSRSFSARREPDVLQRRVQTWLGVPREFLEKYWGTARQTKDMGMGLRFLTYKAKGKSQKACAVIFTVDISNTVKGGEWSGDRESCLRFVKELPQASGQRLVDKGQTPTFTMKLSLR